jgi:hypothetical protein
MPRTKKKFPFKIFLVGLILAVIVVIGVSYLSLPMTGRFPTKTSRPQYCDENGCVPEAVFGLLPPYPTDLDTIYLLIYHNKIGLPEDFTTGVPDENYYKQPEFYPSWSKDSKGYSIYTPLSRLPYMPGHLGVFGYGAYPSQSIQTQVKAGDSFYAVTYLHASWGITKYQGIQLIVTYPEKGETMLGQFSVTQDPNVSRYFTVEVNPKIILLEPNFPQFLYNWTYKIKAKITVSPDTPPGKYLIGVMTTDPPSEIEQQWIRKYRLGYTSAGLSGIGVGTGRPTWEIFVEVV